MGFYRAARLQSLHPPTIKVQEVRLKILSPNFPMERNVQRLEFAIQKFIQTETAENRE